MAARDGARRRDALFATDFQTKRARHPRENLALAQEYVVAALSHSSPHARSKAGRANTNCGAWTVQRAEEQHRPGRENQMAQRRDGARQENWGRAGRTAAGAFRTAAVIGVGANLNLAADDIGLVEGSVTSVLDETGSPCDRELVIAAVVSALERSYQTLENGGSLFEDWTALSAVIGRSVELRTETRTYVGEVSGFAPAGELLLDCEDGARRRFSAGRLELLRGQIQ